jgi:hypothetical protein
LHSAGFANLGAFYKKVRLDRSTVRRALRDARLGARAVWAITDSLATSKEERDEIRSLWMRSKARVPDYTSPNIFIHLLHKQVDDQKYWDYRFGALRAKSGIVQPKPDHAAILSIFHNEVSIPRLAGNYRQAMFNGLVMAQWWRNTMSSSYEDALLATILLTGFSRAASQAEYLPLHRRALRLARDVVAHNESCLEARRLFLDTEAQYRYNYNPNDRKLLRKSLEIHTDEIPIADRIIARNHASLATPDSWYAVTETYQNRMVVMNRLLRNPVQFASDIDRLDAISRTVEYLMISSGVDDGTAAIGKDYTCYRQLFRIQQLDESGRLESAIDLGDALLTDIKEKTLQGSFLVGKAHHLVGKVKLKMLNLSGRNDLAGAVDQHRRIAEASFTRMGNRRLSREVMQDLRV